MPEITRATDSGLHLMARDVTVGASFAISDGAMAVPDGPGLGVGLDQDAMADLTIEERVVDGT
jgi:glucarate dehydratase